MPWIDNLLWDAAIEADTHIAIGPGLRPPDGESACEGREVLYRPGELLVHVTLWNDQGHPLRQQLGEAGAVPIGERPRGARDERRAAAVAEFDLQLVYVRDHDPLGLLRDAQKAGFLDLERASLNHVCIAGPQRHGGDSPPATPVPAPEAVIPAAGNAGTGVRIGVLDTGLVEPPPAVMNTESRPEDLEVVAMFPPGPYGVGVGHGTLVAGVIATYAPGAKLVVRRVLDTPGGVADESEITAALLDLDGLNLDIMNASFSGFSVDDAGTMLAFREAVAHVKDQGTLVVAAVGNEGLDRPAYMAAFDDVVSVASVEGPQHQLASYSNHGDYVKLCAEGTDVKSTWITKQAVVSGTSFAAPKVSAAVAMIMERDGINAEQAAAKLLNIPNPIPKAGSFVDPTNLP
jgi:subtilisin family serine protease